MPIHNLYDSEENEVVDNPLFRNANDFSKYVELVSLNEGRSCTSVILDFCESRDLEPEDISKLVNRSLRAKIAMEMQEDGLMPKTSELVFE